ncbi:Na+/H+ antiporter NhaA [Streptomyces sp. 378]|nr:Na+/H+ antiporter NhaA [Streptomyces sp. 378]MDK1348837.1 Na+/H+ antiporter NhaA [Streptomyces sp. 378]
MRHCEGHGRRGRGRRQKPWLVRFFFGIGGVTHLMRRLGWGALPAGMHHREILGTAALGGIGFTVSLFITGLAVTDAVLISQAKVGVLTAPTVAALARAVLLPTAPAGSGATATPPPPNQDRPGNRDRRRNRMEDRCWTSAHSPGSSPSA